jgi:N-glycosylase/DNA lyase
VQITLLGRYSDLLNTYQLRSVILEKFLSFIGDSKGYEANIPARLKSLKEFSDFVEEFQALKNQAKYMGEDS